MPRPFEKLDAVETGEGLLELRRRGDHDYMILIGGRVLMTSTITTSELSLAENGCAAVAHLPRPRVLIGGLGLGFTLKAALAALPPRAEVIVAELNQKVIEWCQGPVSRENGGAALDRRVHFFLGDVTDEIRAVAEDPHLPRYDAILWDLYVGPTRKGGANDPLYGDQSIANVSLALNEKGVFGVWGETPSPAFEERLRKGNFTPELIETGGGGLRHAVYLATKRSPRSPRTNARRSPRRAKRRS